LIGSSWREDTSVRIIVTRVLESSAAYLQAFRNLTAEETKDLEQFDKSGRVSKRRRIVADLLVYQAGRSRSRPSRSPRE
jgi:hypothetical protein